MSDAPQRVLPVAWFYGAVAVSALLVAATAVPPPASGPAAVLLSRFTLTGENNAAAWWSGMLLAVVSLHAFDGYARLQRLEPGAARGWALIAAVLLFLSFDEVGSFHERLAVLGQALELGTWSLILLLGAVLAAVLGRALVLLWSAGGEQRRKAWAIGISFLVLGSVAVQGTAQRADGAARRYRLPAPQTAPATDRNAEALKSARQVIARSHRPPRRPPCAARRARDGLPGRGG